MRMGAMGVGVRVAVGVEAGTGVAVGDNVGRVPFRGW